MRITKVIIKGKNYALIFCQIVSVILIRKCMKISLENFYMDIVS